MRISRDNVEKETIVNAGCNVILEVTLEQNLAGNQCINRFHYLGTGTPVGLTMSFALISAMGLIYEAGSVNDFPADTIGKRLAAIQSASAHFIQVVARDIYPGPDFYQLPYIAGVAGQVAGECEPPFVAFGLTSPRVTTAIRAGQKRFAGVPESAVGSDGLLSTTPAANLQLLADAMGEVLTFSDTDNSLSFAPIIVSKKEYTTPRGNKAYEYWPTLTEQMAHIAQNITWNGKPAVRSQVSRQYGRGA